MLEGRIALVTGGTSGLGQAIATAGVRHGASVAIVARDEQRGEAVLADIGSDRAMFVPGDVTARADVDRVFDEVTARFGSVDVLINNVGGVTGNAMGPFVDVTEQSWLDMFALNVHAAFHCTQRALPAMLAAGWGRILNMSSVEGKEGMGGLVAYSAAKHALNGLTKAVAREVGTTGITVNSLCPGLCATEGVISGSEAHAAGIGMTVEQLLASFTDRTAIKRLITLDEVAEAAVFLCSAAASGITGVQLSVDGGQSSY
jgi:3-hydroxybutyrate dehydrogenase